VGEGLPRSARPLFAGRGPVRREAGRNGHSAGAYSFAGFFVAGRSGEEPQLAEKVSCICGRSSVAIDGARPVTLSRPIAVTPAVNKILSLERKCK
jgi:hypothetical protein